MQIQNLRRDIYINRLTPYIGKTLIKVIVGQFASTYTALVFSASQSFTPTDRPGANFS